MMKNAKALVLWMILIGLFMVSCDDRNPNQPLVLPAPVFDPVGGTYDTGQEVTITCATEDAIIRYTLNGSEPTPQTFQYTNPLSVSAIIPTNANSVTIKAKAYKEGNNPSPTVTATYAVSYASTVAVPTILPHNGNLLTTSLLYMSCPTENAQIRWTIDGSEPNVNSTLFEGFFPLAQIGAITMKAKGFKYHMNPSPTVTANFTVFTPSNVLVLVDGGTFDNASSDVTLSNFYIDPFEVTQASYTSVMGINPATGYGVGDNYPVYYVSWFDAIEYCNRRSGQSSITPCYSYDTFGTNPDDWPEDWNTTADNHTSITCNWTANGYRLPTEAEWEFAARGGNSTHDYQYSGGNDLYDVGWFWNNWGAQYQCTQPIGGLVGNERMLFDLSGNIAEWVWDIHGEYSTEPQDNPHGPPGGSNRVYRGGSWRNYSDYCKVWYRASFTANVSTNLIGFRVVRRSL